MANSKFILIYMQFFLFFSQYVSSQSVPNGTIYIPGEAVVTSQLGVPTAIVVSQVTVQGESTVFQLVDGISASAGTEALTATLELSPTGASLSAAPGIDGIGPVDITCSIADGTSSCELKAAVIAGGVTLPITSTFSEATSGVPVIAVNFASGSESAMPSASPSESSSSQTTLPSITQSPVVSNNTSSSGSSSGTAPASAASTTQPSSAMSLHKSTASVFISICFFFVLITM